MELTIHTEHNFQYVEEGEGPNIILLHGLFGALSNWQTVLSALTNRFRVLIPLMPVYQVSKVPPSVTALVDFVSEFMEAKRLTNVSLIGNSLGGHIGLLLTLKHPNWVRTLTLTGSSGLFESGMGGTFPRRGDRSFIRERVEFTFYNPITATDDLVNEVFDIVNDSGKAVRVIKIAREAQRMNMRDDLSRIQAPTCLIWGLNDNITPSYVAHEFHRLIQLSELNFLDRCGHAPMMEQPEQFNHILHHFLAKYY